MPPKRPTTIAVEDLIDALSDQRVIDALTKGLGDSISSSVASKMDAKISKLFESINGLRADYDKISQEVVVLQTENLSLKRQLDDLDSYSRSDNLVIHGIKESSYAESASGTGSRGSAADATEGSQRPGETNVATEQSIVEFCNNILDINLTRDDISVAHRIGKSRNSSLPAPIIVRFTNRRARNAVYGARKSLAGKKPSVYINEHLTQHRSFILRDARQLVKAKKLQGAWTNNGIVYIKLSNLPDSRPIRVDDAKDLPRG